MTEKQKYQTQFKEVKAGVSLLYNQVSLTINASELLRILDKFNSYMQRFAKMENNSHTRIFTAFIEFLHNESSAQRSYEKVVMKSKLKKLSHKISWKDYQSEIIILRMRGHSWRDLEKYCLTHFKVKVSRDTLRNHLSNITEKELKNDLQ
jgi:hypothetical protein